MTTVVFHRDGSVRLGRSVYSVRYTERPEAGFHEYSIETSGNPTRDGLGKFDLYDLKGIHFADLPDSFSLTVYDPRLDERKIDSLILDKDKGKAKVTMSLSHYYRDWTYQKNLIHFYHDLRDSLLQQPPYPANVEVDADEVAVSAHVTYQANESDDLLTHVAKAAKHISKALEKQLIAESGTSLASPWPNAGAVAQQLKPDEHGWKWWLRYIVLPASLALIALSAGLAKLVR